ncbi:MAG: hypothetical protein AB7F74_05815 [Parvibaculaceae bacterium]
MPGHDSDATAALFAALHRFPGRARDIKSLMGRNEDFCEMCEELAMAEGALANIATVPAAEREARIEECKVWIARLTGEISEALEKSNVVPMGSHDRSR